MARQFSVAVRNARAAAYEATVGTSAIMKFRTGAQPATCATADSGTVIATLNLPADYMAAPAAGAVAKSGTWEDLIADAAGLIGHYRIYASDGTTCHDQGSVGDGSGGDLTLDNADVEAGQKVTVTAYGWTELNA